MTHDTSAKIPTAPHPSNRVNMRTLGVMFTHHPATRAQLEAYAKIRAGALAFAGAVYDACPPCADTSAAIRKIREAVMTASAAVALDPGAK